MNDSLRDAGIPVLTEVIDAAVNSPSAATLSSQTKQTATPKSSQLPAHAASAGRKEPDWSGLENEIRERIVNQVLANIDSVLETRIRDTLADVLQVAVGSLAADIRAGLQKSLEQEIAHAIAEQIARSRNSGGEHA